MNSTSSIDNKIKSYLGLLNEHQKKTLLVVAKTFADESNPEGPIYSNDFIAELDRRTRSLEEGSIKGSSWSEVKRKAHQAVKTKNKLAIPSIFIHRLKKNIRFHISGIIMNNQDLAIVLKLRLNPCC